MAGLNKIKIIAENLRSLTEKEIYDQLKIIVKNNESTILELNRRQLLDGEDSDGNKLAPYKNKYYAKKKRAMNPKGVTDLKLTGSTHENMFLVSELPLIIFSYDYKATDLSEKYGKAIFGLQTESKDVLVLTKVKPEFQKWFRERVLLQRHQA